jgi:hypothetical protein
MLLILMFGGFESMYTTALLRWTMGIQRHVMATSVEVAGLAVTMADIICNWTGSKLSKPRRLALFVSILSVLWGSDFIVYFSR